MHTTANVCIYICVNTGESLRRERDSHVEQSDAFGKGLIDISITLRNKKNGLCSIALRPPTLEPNCLRALSRYFSVVAPLWYSTSINEKSTNKIITMFYGCNK